MKRLKIAVIGVGSISQSHIGAYLKHEDVELYALCDIDAARLQEKGKKYGVERLYTDAEEMLRALPEIDAVSVCTWNSAHASCAIAALSAGKHVLCEKPMALSAAEAESMRGAAERSGKKLMIGFVRRFGNDCAVLKDFVDNGALGEVYYAKATYLRRNGNPGGWFGDKSRSGGGPLIDLGVHVIDLVRYILGNPKVVSVNGYTFRKLGNRKELKTTRSYVAETVSKEEICDVEDFAAAVIRFDNGAVLNVETSFALQLKKDSGKIELFGTKGGASLDPELELYTDMLNYPVDVTPAFETALSFDGLFEAEINHFVDCVINDRPLLAPAEDGVEMMKILDAIYRSAREEREVFL